MVASLARGDRYLDAEVMADRLIHKRLLATRMAPRIPLEASSP